MHLWVSISFLSQLQSNSHGGRTYQPEVRSLYCTGSALIYLADFLPGAAASLRAAPAPVDHQPGRLLRLQVQRPNG